MNAKKISGAFFGLDEWGNLGQKYVRGTTAYGIEAVLGGGGLLLICSVLNSCSPAHVFSGVCCTAACCNAAINPQRVGMLHCNIDMYNDI